MGNPIVEPKPARARRHYLILSFLAGCLVAGTVIAAPVIGATPAPIEPREAGLPLMHHFAPSDYDGSAQNWSLAQDRQGVIYVGNLESGVLTFDGARWRRIPIPANATVRSLAADDDGRVYVGAVGNLGYLQTDTDGHKAFVSLLDKIPPANRDFSDVWSTFANGKDVWFSTDSSLFRYRDGKMTVWKPKTAFHTCFMVDGTLYINEVGVGLMRMVDDHLRILPGGSRFANEKIYALLPWRGPNAQPGDLLIGTLEQGWLIWRNGRFLPWATEADPLIRQKYLYGATWLADGRLAVATLSGGVILLDAQGHLLRTLTRASGLGSNTILAMLQDHQHGLWLASGNGITRLSLGSPLTLFDQRSGLQGEIFAMQRLAGSLYVGTTEGLFRLIDGPDPHFVPVPQVHGQIWSLADAGDQWMASGDGGVFVFAGTQLVQRLDTHGAAVLALAAAPDDPGNMFAGYEDGLGMLRHEGQHWVDAGRVPGIKEELHGISLIPPNHVWLSPWTGGAMRLDLPPDWRGPDDARYVDVARYGTAAGLPDGSAQALTINGALRFTTTRGIYRFNEANGRFTPDPAFATLLPGPPRQLTPVVEDTSGMLWMHAGAGADGSPMTGHAILADSHWHWQSTWLQQLDSVGVGNIRNDRDGTVWLASDNGLYRYHRRPGDTPPAPPSTLLRAVRGPDGHALPLDQGKAQIPYARNTLEFVFAVPNFADPAANRYQVKLQGLDKTWSPWSRDDHHEYSRLPVGNYRFLVHARNVYGKIGPDTHFDFSVLPPWYRTLWAWLLWTGLAALALALLLHWRARFLLQRNRKLNDLIAQRTVELAQANRTLAEQTVTDPLTGLKNRRYLHEHIEQDVAGARRRPESSDARLLFMMVDIDHFKQVNDNYGHAAGDQVLRQMGGILRAVARDTDVPLRWGGEEFLIVARFADDQAGPLLAERLRTAVAAYRFDVGNNHTIERTCSIGFASFPAFAKAPDRLSWEQVASLADQCLYQAKHNGRNAWAGLLPMATPPPGDVAEALDDAFSTPGTSTPLRLATSWPRNTP